MALSASAREIRFALLWITRVERPGGQVRVASCLPEIVDIPGEIQHFLRRKIVPRHCSLQIRPAGAHNRPDQIAITISPDKWGLEIGGAHHGLTQVRSVAEMGVVEHVHGTAALERPRRRRKTACIRDRIAASGDGDEGISGHGLTPCENLEFGFHVKDPDALQITGTSSWRAANTQCQSRVCARGRWESRR